MEPFMRSDQYHFIKAQTQHLINGHASVNDTAVLRAIKQMAEERVLQLFDELTDVQKQLLTPITDVEDRGSADAFLSRLKSYVIPFEEINEQTIKKLFRKAKKVKVPEHVDLKEISYLGWDDNGSNKRYIIAYIENKPVGLQGTFLPANQKGICTICNHHEEIGLFSTETKTSVPGALHRKGNYICVDSQTCNENITNLEKLNEFVIRLSS